MARLYNTGFELNTQATGIECTTNSNTTVQSTTVRSGVYAAQITSLVSGTARGMRFTFVTAAGNGPFWFRTYFRYATAPSAANTIIQVNDTNAFTTQIASIELNNDGTLQLRDEDGTIGSPSSALSSGTWYRIELRIDLTGGAGAHVVEAQLDGSTFATSSTRSLSAGILTFNIGGNCNAEAQTTGNWYFDDIAINDGTGSFQNGYPGEGELIILRPDGDSGTPQWTRGGTDSGANWSQIEELPPDDVTTYVTSNTLDEVDNYTLEATPAALASDDIINCVTVGGRWTVDNATGGDPDIELGITAGGNTDVSSAIDLSTTAWFTNGTVSISYPLVSYDMPGASTTAWTKADLDGATIRLREAASDTHFARVTALWVYVDHKPAPVGGATKVHRLALLGVG